MLEKLLSNYVKNNKLQVADLEKAKNISSQQQITMLDAVVTIKPDLKDELLEDLSDELNLIYVDIYNFNLSPEASYLLDEDFARRNLVLPLFRIRNWLFVITVYPIDAILLNEIRKMTGLYIRPCIGIKSDIQFGLDKLYQKSSSAEKMIQQISEVGEDLGTSISRLVGLVIAQAVREGASDIHIEPEEKYLRIRFRIDGILHEIPSPPKELEPAIVSRIKVMSSLDIAESRVPQDGHFTLNVDGRDIDVRVSTLPTINGENLVMRILDTSNVLIGLEKLGFSKDSLKRFRQAISHPYGIILTTGPTGSGKTTTLYSALMELNSLERHIVTIEDPVEYRLPLIRQVQINPKAGLNFASGLRSILRHDPDIIMVGEIRDLETAMIAVQSALTGHLVFSTLHTNDAVSSITRLTNMGIEPFLISASLICAMAQRLVRKICQDCKESYKPNTSLLEKLGFKEKGGDLVLYRGKGCDSCKGTGYRGRTGLFELLLVDDEIRELIVSNASLIQIRQVAERKGMKLLYEDGIEKALKGITTIEEVARVCEEKVEVSKGRQIKPEVKPVIMKNNEASPPEIDIDEEELETYAKKFMDWISKKAKSDA